MWFRAPRGGKKDDDTQMTGIEVKRQNNKNNYNYKNMLVDT